MQHIPASETEPAERLTLRDCPCGSTIAMPETVDEYRARVEENAGRNALLEAAGFR